jgi:hypothetical protein
MAPETLAAPPETSAHAGSTVAPSAVSLGVVAGFDATGAPLLEIEGARGLVGARTVPALSAGDVGRQAVLAFVDGDRMRPVVLGLLQPLGTAQAPEARPAGEAPALLGAAGHGEERLVLTAARELVLRCGEASLTLTRAGKVLIRGAYVLTRASGVNRIKGGSVQIN